LTSAQDPNATGSGLQATQPPLVVTVTGITPVLDKTHRIIQVRIALSGRLDAGAAQSTENYRLVTAGMKSSFTAWNARVVALRSSCYDPASDTITLTLGKAVPKAKPV
jgi:hypothetical protein